MSTYYLPNGKIPFDELKGLSDEDIQEVESKGTNADNICLSDGEGFLWASRLFDGSSHFARYGRNNVNGIINSLQAKFKVRIYHEHDPKWDDLVAQHPEDFLTIDLVGVEAKRKQEKDK
jgi:hypothetical protein